MTDKKQTVFSILKGILIVITGYLALRVVNLPRSWFLDTVFHLNLSGKGFPLDTSAQTLYLVYIFLAGTIAAFVVGMLATNKPWLHLWIFCGLLLVNDIYAIVSPLSDQPAWVKIVILLSLVPQVWLGGKLGIMVRK